MEIIASIVSWLNAGMNFVFGYLFAPVAVLGGWLSMTIISVAVGPLLMLIFKYTSNQKAIARVGDSIKANMLAMKLYRDSLQVTLESLGNLFKGAGLKLCFALLPMLVMTLPVTLLLGQMSLWYHARPLVDGEQTLVTVTIRGEVGEEMPAVSIMSIDGGEVAMEQSKFEGCRQYCWKVRATKGSNQAGQIVFDVGGEEVVKEFAVGESLMRVSGLRPGGEEWTKQLLNPWEKPFGEDSAVKSVSVEYPARGGTFLGMENWIWHFFIVSMVSAIVFMPVFKVKF